ncbi:unnamed protein product, partial [Prorocentrum cordatum]
ALAESLLELLGFEWVVSGRSRHPAYGSQCAPHLVLGTPMGSISYANFCHCYRRELARLAGPHGARTSRWVRFLDSKRGPDTGLLMASLFLYRATADPPAGPSGRGGPRGAGFLPLTTWSRERLALMSASLGDQHLPGGPEVQVQCPDEPRPRHRRAVMRRCPLEARRRVMEGEPLADANSIYWITTPDFDVYSEELSAPPLTGVAGTAPDGGALVPAPGIGRAAHLKRARAFSPLPTPAAFAEALRAGLGEVAQLVGVFGIAGGPALGGRRRVSNSGLGDSDFTSDAKDRCLRAPGIALASRGGELMVLVDCSDAAAAAAPEQGARVLEISRDELGNRRRGVMGAIDCCAEGAWVSWPLTGPRTAMWCLTFTAQTNGHPRARRARWKHACRLASGDHEAAMKGLGRALTHDRLAVPEFVFAVFFLRRVQLAEFRRRRLLLRPDDYGGDSANDEFFYLGLGEASGHVMSRPALEERVAPELRRESTVAMGRRKLREGRQLARASPGAAPTQAAAAAVALAADPLRSPASAPAANSKAVAKPKGESATRRVGIFQTYFELFLLRRARPWKPSRSFAALERASTVGILCVRQKSGMRRRILGARPVNARFQEAGRTILPMPCVWASVELQPEDELVFSQMDLVAVAACVDIAAIACADEKRVTVAADAVIRQLEADGLDCKTIEHGPDIAHFTGLGLHRASGRISAGHWRCWAGRPGLSHVVAVGHASGPEIHSLLGHYTWSAILRRRWLSPPHACYCFVDKAGLDWVPLWPSVRRLVGWMISLPPLAYADAKPPLVWQRDRDRLRGRRPDRQRGFLCRSEVQARAWRRQRGRWRFAVADAAQARAAALAAAASPAAAAAGADAEAASSVLGVAYNHLDGSAIGDFSSWQLRVRGRWRRAEGIASTGGRLRSLPPDKRFGQLKASTIVTSTSFNPADGPSRLKGPVVRGGGADPRDARGRVGSADAQLRARAAAVEAFARDELRRGGAAGAAAFGRWAPPPPLDLAGADDAIGDWHSAASSADSSSSSDDEGACAEAHRARASVCRDLGAPFLGANRATRNSATLCDRCLSDFRKWAAMAGMPLFAPAEIDFALEEHLEDLYFSGFNHDAGETVVVGVEFRIPELQIPGGTVLPRAKNALRSFRRLAPGRTFAPLSATGGQLVPPRPGAATASWALLLAPSELSVASKTHEFDESLLLNNVEFGPPRPEMSALFLDSDEQRHLEAQPAAATKMARALLLAAVALAPWACAQGPTPVQKVIELLEGMLAKGKEDKKAEQVNYAAFSQFCEDTEVETSRNIKEAEEKIATLKADIEEYKAEAARLQEEAKLLEGDISAWQGDDKAATKVRDIEKAAYDELHQDYSESVSALKRAIEVLKAKAHDLPQASMAQLSALQTRRLIPKEARQALAAFLQDGQGPEAPDAMGYEFHAHGIIEMLEKLLDKFTAERTGIENQERTNLHEYELLIQPESASPQQPPALLSAQRQPGGLAPRQPATCSQKGEQFQARQQLRAEELVAVEKAIEIIKGETVTGYAEKHLPTLMHVQASRTGSRVLSMLAARVEADPFAKVKQLIKDLITRLLEEASDEAEHKSWCDTELSTNEQTRKEKTAQVEILHAEKDGLETSIAKLAEELSKLADAIADLDKAMAEATDLRTTEKAKNDETIDESQQAQKAVAQALVVLKEFYAKAAEATALVQQEPLGRVEPPRNPDIPKMYKSAYKGMGGEAKGVVGMLEVIETDFARLEADTKAAEAAAQKEYDMFMADSKEDKATKEKEVENKNFKKQDEAQALVVTQKNLEGTQKELDASLAYFDKLKPSCIDVGVAYEDRVERRKEEIASLQEALKILSGEDIA